jgi:NADP-dependent 3-hydroxy acid dehydrogenase YdfG
VKQSQKVTVVQFDLLSDDSIKSAVKTVEEKVGNEGLSLLINNAGVYMSDGNNVLNPDRDAIMKVFSTNVAGIMVSFPVSFNSRNFFKKRNLAVPSFA